MAWTSPAVTKSAWAASRSPLPFREDGDLEEPDASIGTGDDEAPPSVADVGDRGLEYAGGEQPAFLHQFVRADHHGSAAHAGGARAVGACTADHAVGITEHDLDAVEGDAQGLGHNLREHGGVAHAEVLGAGADNHPAVPSRLDLGKLGRRAAIVLDVHRAPEAAEGPSGLACRAARREAPPVRQLERALEVLPEGARSEDGPARCRPGKGPGLHEVSPAQLDAIDPGLARRRLDQALCQIVRLDATYSPKGGQRCRVGEHAAQGHVAARDAIGSTEGWRQVVGHHPDVATRQVRAVAPVDSHSHGGEPSLTVQRQLTV